MSRTEWQKNSAHRPRPVLRLGLHGSGIPEQCRVKVALKKSRCNRECRVVWFHLESELIHSTRHGISFLVRCNHIDYWRRGADIKGRIDHFTTNNLTGRQVIKKIYPADHSTIIPYLSRSPPQANCLLHSFMCLQIRKPVLSSLSSLPSARTLRQSMSTCQGPKQVHGRHSVLGPKKRGRAPGKETHVYFTWQCSCKY